VPGAVVAGQKIHIPQMARHAWLGREGGELLGVAGETGARVQVGPRGRRESSRHKKQCKAGEGGFGGAHGLSPGQSASQRTWHRGQNELALPCTGRGWGRGLSAQSQHSQWSIPTAWPTSCRTTPRRVSSVRLLVETRATPLPRGEYPRTGAPSESRRGRFVSPRRGRCGKVWLSQASRSVPVAVPQGHGSTQSASGKKGSKASVRGDGNTAPSRTSPRVTTAERSEDLSPKAPPPR
jgi:hypothetical protein